MKMVMDMQVEFSDEVLERVAEKIPEVKSERSSDKGIKSPQLALRFEKFGGKILLSSRTE